VMWVYWVPCNVSNRKIFFCEGVVCDLCRAIELVRLEGEFVFGLGCTCEAKLEYVECCLVVLAIYLLGCIALIRLRGLFCLM